MQEVTEANLIPGECRASFPNMNGGRGRWATSFLPPQFVYTPAIQACGKQCGRSGYCYQVGGPNQRCGPQTLYQFGMCANPAGNADNKITGVLADL